MGIIKIKNIQILLGIIIYFSVYFTVIAGQNRQFDFIDYGECFKIEIDEKEVNEVINALSGIKYDSYKFSVRSQCFYKLKKYQLALKDISTVIANNPELPMVHQHRGKINFEMKNYNDAIKDFLYAIKNNLNSQDNEAYLYLSNAYQKINRFEEAESILLKLLARLSERYVGENQYSDVTRIHYDEIPVYLALSELYVRHNSTDKAIKLLKKGVDDNNGSIELFDQLMFLLKESNEMKLYSNYRKQKCNKPLIMRSQYCL